MLRLTLCLALVVSLSACGSRLNPFNWFGNDREERVTVTETEVLQDPRQLVAEVVSLGVEAVPQGAIIRATGLPPTQGFWAVDLVEVERTDTTVIFEFRVLPPTEATRVSTQRSREVIAVTELNRYELAGLRTITVIGQQNRRSVSRR